MEERKREGSERVPKKIAHVSKPCLVLTCIQKRGKKFFFLPLPLGLVSLLNCIMNEIECCGQT